MSARLAEIRLEYPATVEFDVIMDTCTHPREGSRFPTPVYEAGCLLNPQWIEKVYFPRVGARSHREIIPMAVMKHGDSLTTTIRRHYDHGGHLFLELCDNSPKNQHTRDKWLEKRDEHLKAICEALDFTAEEIEQAQRNFKWYMTTPAGILEVALENTVHGSILE